MIRNAEILFKEAEASRYWGDLIFKFQAGKLVLIKKEETILPSKVKNRKVVQDAIEGSRKVVITKEVAKEGETNGE